MRKNLASGKNAIRISQEQVCRKEELCGLKASGLLEDFIRENSNKWDHQKWIGLCDKIMEKGYTHVDLDQVGLLLEEIRSRYPNI